MSKRMSRRALLRGAGTVAVGLPFLEEMTLGSAFGAPGSAPCRMVTAFFGLGLYPEWQNDFAGPLEPFSALASKMAMFSVNMGQGSVGGAHCNTSAVVFVGERQDSVNVAGGPSIDQLMRRELDPSAPVLVSGLWWRCGACDAQALRVFNPDGSPRTPIKRPSEVFDNVFGSYMPPMMGGMENEALRRELRIKRSILDTVMEEYRALKGDSSFLGAESKLKLDQHLSSIREIELQLAPADTIIDDPPPMGCSVPARPTDPPIADYDRLAYGTGSGAPGIPWQDFQQVYRLHADLWAVALRCDLVRYGNLMFESAGGHTNFSGTYNAMGDSTTFPGDSQHDSYFHAGQDSNARLYQHLAMSNIAYFLEQLDDSNYLEANGRTVLDNSCVVIGTEYGKNHDKNDAFCAVAGGGGRFNSGFFTNRTMNCIDLYNAVLSGYGIDANIGQATGVSSEGDASVLLA